VPAPRVGSKLSRFVPACGFGVEQSVEHLLRRALIESEYSGTTAPNSRGGIATAQLVRFLDLRRISPRE
jgi:hypothetical protein